MTDFSLLLYLTNISRNPLTSSVNCLRQLFKSEKSFEERFETDT